jgi:hypothetical protein
VAAEVRRHLEVQVVAITAAQVHLVRAVLIQLEVTPAAAVAVEDGTVEVPVEMTIHRIMTTTIPVAVVDQVT